MHFGHYAHPEFGWLSPTPRWRRELRTRFLSGLFGIGIGAAGVLALNGYASIHDVPTSHEVRWQQPPAVAAGDNTLQTARIDDDFYKNHSGKPDGSAPAHSTNGKTNPATTCEDNNSSCLDLRPVPGK